MTYRVNINFSVNINADNKQEAINTVFDIIKKNPSSIGYKIEVKE